MRGNCDSPEPDRRAALLKLMVWLATPEAATAFNLSALSPADQARYAAVRTKRRRHDFEVSRALLSHVGAIASGSGSRSHSDGYAALAHASAAARLSVCVGVDLEGHKPRDVRSIAQFAFALEEAEALACLPGGERLRRFYALWTMKEALAKALQLPLLTVLRQCVFVESEGGWRVQTPNDAPCSVIAFEPRPTLTLAVACVGAQIPIVVHGCEWPPERSTAWPIAAQVNHRGARAVPADADGVAPVPRGTDP